MYPKIYLGQTPSTPHGRRALRLRALDLHQRFQRPDDGAPTYVLLHFTPQSAAAPVDLLLLRPGAAFVGVIKEVEGPLDIRPNGQWILRVSGAQVRGPRGETPLEQITQGREQVRQRLEQALRSDAERAGPLVGALICAPTTHPETRVVLDIEDHRQRIKVMGLDELPALAAMVQTGAALDEPAMRQIVADVFGGRQWHDGERLLFELGLAPFRLRLLARGDRSEQHLQLIEGANVVGRRAAPLQHEYRLSLEGDDSVSNDHAILVCSPDGRASLRDTSTNGTWVAAPGEPEQRIHHAERSLAPNSTIRMGETRMLLEPSDQE